MTTKIPASNKDYATLADLAEGKGKTVRVNRDMLSRLCNSYSIIIGDLKRGGTLIIEGVTTDEQ